MKVKVGGFFYNISNQCFGWYYGFREKELIVFISVEDIFYNFIVDGRVLIVTTLQLYAPMQYAGQQAYLNWTILSA